MRDQLAGHTFVMRTDVKGYYDGIDHHLMLARLAVYVPDRSVLNLLWQVMRRTVTWGGLYRDCERGIARGCPLSPLLGAFFLHELDREMEKLGLFYVRFMDDILVLAPTRWSLRRAVHQVNAKLSSLKLEKHPDKTFIGRIDKGFEFLGYQFSRAGIAIAATSAKRFVEHAVRLYEQERRAPGRAPSLGTYVRRWCGWATGGRGLAAQADPPAGVIHAMLERALSASVDAIRIRAAVLRL